jgi:hypothetical protein
MATDTPTFEGFERHAKRNGFCGLFVYIERDEFYVSCRWYPGEARLRWCVDDVPTPANQVAALLENAALAEAKTAELLDADLREADLRVVAIAA